MLGMSSNPKTETISSIHHLCNITPGAIASVAVFVSSLHPLQPLQLIDYSPMPQARWALSADEILQSVGSNTGINYFADYEEYVHLLEMGLYRRKKTIINLFKEWDRLVFPNTGSSLVGGSQSQESAGMKKAMALLDADDDESGVEED